jgi:alkylhydroperoxidase family enzyme
MGKAESMANITDEHRALVRRILEGDGRATHAQRRAAFDNSGLTGPLRTLTDKVAKHAYRVTDDDIAAARSSGVTEDQIFELAVSAAVGQATRQYETALAALEAATEGTAHASRDPR